MRIVFANSSNELVGGAETYLQAIAQHFAAQGHSIGIWYERGVNDNARTIQVPKNASQWNVSELGPTKALEELQKWKPELIYSQGLIDPELDFRLQNIAPSVLFAHNYNGLCISGERTLNWPVQKPCEHQFGRACLARYYPQRCGGLSPFTMWRDYQCNTKRLQSIAGYRAVVTHSNAVVSKYREHGIECTQVRFFIEQAVPAGSQEQEWEPNDKWRLLMLGRMVSGKGGDILLDSLPFLARQLERPFSLMMAGDGPDRSKWISKTRQLKFSREGCEIVFPGWLSASARNAALQRTDLLVVPSVWPEPFGLVGLEAGLFHVPAVAFSVGGIPDWLSDGINGYTAPGESPNSRSLAEAIVRCLSDLPSYKEMRVRARAKATTFTIEGHYGEIMAVFTRILASN